MDSQSIKNTLRWKGWRRGGKVFLLTCLIFCGGVRGARSAEEIAVPERRAFEAARIALDDGLYDYSEKRFSEFLSLYPSSPLVPQVKLFLAQTQYHLKKYEVAFQLLNENMALATDASDQYLYWIGEISYAEGRSLRAGDAYAALISKYPDSKLVLSAAFKQGFILYQKQDYEGTIALFLNPDGAFEKARQKDSSVSHSILGLLTLADSQFSLGQYEDAEKTLGKLPDSDPGLETTWQRISLLARILQATDRFQEASDLMPRVLVAAEQLMKGGAIAESHALNAGLLEQLGKNKEAIAAYKPNLNPKVAKPWRRQALVKTVELSLETGNPEDAIGQLKLLSAGGLDGPARDLVQLTLGELQLKMFYALPFDQRVPGGGDYSLAASNVLISAQVHFTNVINEYTNSPYLGKAWVNRAWCEWQMQHWEAAVSSFSNATLRLPKSLDHAIAVFKTGDSQFKLQQYTNALFNYNRVLNEYGENDVIKRELLDQVYYQIIQSGIALGDLDVVVPAMQALIGQFPGSFYSDRSMLLVGQALNDIRDPAGARKVFETFNDRFAGSSLEPEVHLAIARTYELEENWPAAVAIYGRWLTANTNHASIASAKFGEAWSLSRAGGITNALVGFTNFVTAFPAHKLTPVALQWLGDRFYSTRDYARAELYYQKLFTGTNWSVSPITFQARVLAGRSALGRQDHPEAKRYLTNLLNMADCPTDVRAGAFYAYGDVLMSEPGDDPGKFVDARGAFDRIVSEHGDSVDVPAALGRIGDCNFQLKLYGEATNAYTRCMEHPLAGVQARGQAEVKLGKSLEKLAEVETDNRDELLKQAMYHYLNVFLQQNVNEEKNEQPDPFWIQRAGLDAAALAEAQKEFKQAASLYRSLKDILPQMSTFLDQRIEQQENLARR